MRVLGISCFYHDAAAALVVDGQLVAAAEEERFSRIKHDFQFPTRAVSFCLERAGIRGEDLDLVVFYEKPFLKLDRILMSALATFPRSAEAFREGCLVWLLDKLWARDLLQERIGCRRDRILFCPHHVSHAASAFYCSPFESSALLTVDGVGEWATGARGTAWGHRLSLDEETRYPHSLGLLYSAFTAFLGFQVNEGEYKVMGMAPYGQPRFTDLILDRLVHLREDGSFRMDMDYFAWHHSASRSFTPKFEELFGRARTPQASNLLDPHYADIAASIQKAAEEILVRQAAHLHRKTGHADLCMAGGVALNSVANARILRESGFRRLYIQPAAGDGGGALGAALWGTHEILGLPRQMALRHVYWGQEHDDAAVADFLRAQGVEHRELSGMEAVYDEVAERLAHGQVVGWMQGRFEWGPRALGARSILADPRAAHMKDVVNARIKFREPFRPFAPSVLAERVEDYFELPGAISVDPARFMLLVVPVLPHRQGELPAVTHVDGTARIQAVHRQESPLYHGVISRFCDRTGVPVVLNTSFNLRGEPIVNTPAEAWSTFHRSDMDALVMGRFLVSRRAAGEGRLVPGAELEKWSHAPSASAAPEPPPEPGPGAQGRGPGRGRLARLLASAAAVLAISALLLELFVRLALPNPNLQVGGMFRQTARGVRLTPGWRGRIHTAEFDCPVEIAGSGLREVPEPVGPPMPRRRLLVLGDSFTFGSWSAAEEMWLHRLQQALGGRIRVVNGGWPNSGTSAQLELFREMGDAVAPDMVLLAVYPGNDLYDALIGPEAVRVEGGRLVLTDAAARRWRGYDCLGEGASPTPTADPEPPRPLAWARGLLRASHLYQALRQIGDRLGAPPGVLRPHQTESWFLKRYRPEMEQAVASARGALDALLAESRRRGLPLGLVVIPSKSQVEDDTWQAWLAASGLDPALFDRGRPSRVFEEWARDNRVPLLDLLPALRGRAPMYYRADMHWNALGHFQAGERTAALLVREGWVEAP